MYIKLGIGLAIIILTYIALPNFYFKYYSSSVKRRFTNSNNIFLTFDDGPSPIYTMKILDLLKKHNIKATFFVVARKSKGHKEIIDRIIDEGHTLGLHSYTHKSQWLYSPWQTRKDFQKSILALQELEQEPKYYRPPWGRFNLFTNYYARKDGLKSICWSIITRDWDHNATVDSTVNKIVNNIKAGDIIVLHDSNHNINDCGGAPANTIEALKVIIPTLMEKGYNFQTIEEGMEGSKKVGVNI